MHDEHLARQDVLPGSARFHGQFDRHLLARLRSCHDDHSPLAAVCERARAGAVLIATIVASLIVLVPNISIAVIFWAIEIGAQYLLQHEFVKALHKRFKKESMEMSSPARKLVWDGSKSLPAESVTQEASES